MICPEIEMARPRPATAEGTPGAASITRCTRLLLLLILLMGVLGAVVPTAVQAASFLERAQEYFAEGDMEAASVELKNALQRHPNDAEARFLLGKVHLQLGDPASAEKELLKARELGLDSQELDLMLAYARLGQQRFDTVVSSIDEEVRAESEVQRDLYVARGEALLGLGKFDEANAVFDRVLQDGPHVQALVNKSRIAIALSEMQEARNLLDRAAAIDPRDPRLLAVDGAWYFQERRFEEAQDRFVKAAQLDPTRLESHIGRIQSLLHLGELDEAAGVVETLRKRNPNVAAVVLQDGIVQFLRGRFQDAETAAEQVLAVAPAQPQALLVAGHSAFQLKKYEKARAQLGAYLAQNPQDHQARMVLGLTMLSLGYADQAYGTLKAPDGGEIPDQGAYLDALTTAAFTVGDKEAGLKYLEKLAAKQPDDAALQERLGITRQALGDAEGGAEALERAIELDPDRHGTYLQLFTARMQQKRAGLALEVAQRVQDHFPDKASGDTLLGIVYLTMRERDKAREAFARAVEKEPDDAQAAGNLVNILRIEGKTGEARAVLDRVLKTAPGHLSTLLTAAELATEAGDHAAAESLWQQAIDHNPDAVQPRISLGNRYIASNRPGEALVVAEPALAANPNSLGLLETVGQARLRTGDRAGALRSFETLAKLVPDSARAQEYLMWALQENGRTAEALEAAERTLALDPNIARARFGQVRYLAQLGQLEEAEEQLAGLREDFPDDVELLLIEGRIALAEKRGDEAVAIHRKAFELRQTNFMLIELVRALFATSRVDEGLTAMQDWLVEFPEDRFMRTTLAETYMAMGRLPEAEQQYEAILNIAPDSAWALNNLAWLRMMLGRAEEAVPPARRAAGLAPGEPEIADTLAVILLEVGEKREALDLLRNARRADSDSLTIHFHFARALAANGETEGAVNELRALLQKEGAFRERPNAEALLTELTRQ